MHVRKWNVDAFDGEHDDRVDKSEFESEVLGQVDKDSE